MLWYTWKGGCEHIKRVFSAKILKSFGVFLLLLLSYILPLVLGYYAHKIINFVSTHNGNDQSSVINSWFNGIQDIPFIYMIMKYVYNILFAVKTY